MLLPYSLKSWEQLPARGLLRKLSTLLFMFTLSLFHPVPTSTPLKNRYSHPIPSFCYVVEKKRRHILPICHFLCFFFISINLNNSMHFRQSSNNKYLYLLLFQSHCRWDSLFQTCLSFPVFQSRYRMRLSILEVDTYRTGVKPSCIALLKIT